MKKISEAWTQRLLGVVKRRGGWLVLGLFAAISVLIATFSLHMERAAQQRRDAEQWHIHTLEVLERSQDLRIGTYDILRGERGYLLTGKDDFLQPYRRGRDEALLAIDGLASLTSDNPVQRRLVEAARGRFTSFVDTADHIITLSRGGDQDAALVLVRAGQGRRLFEDLQASLDQVDEQERQLLIQRRTKLEAAATATDRLGQLAGILIILLFALAAVAAILALRAHRRAQAAVEELRRQATVDELTGLPNRRLFLSRLEIELARARRGGSPLCLATLGIDHFKLINDTHGHAAGDAVLRQLAPIVREKIRLDDSAARIGGEEFVLLLPNTNAHQAHLVCDRLRAAVAARLFEKPDGGAIRATLSTGVALLHQEDDGASLMRRSDEALYDAKAGGRNQVRLAA